MDSYNSIDSFKSIKSLDDFNGMISNLMVGEDTFVCVPSLSMSFKVIHLLKSLKVIDFYNTTIL